MAAPDIYSEVIPFLGHWRLSPAQWRTLFLLWLSYQGKEPEYGKPLSTSGRSAAAVRSRMLRRLEERGYIVRLAAGPSKRRTGSLALTVSGKEFMDKLMVSLTAKKPQEPPL